MDIEQDILGLFDPIGLSETVRSASLLRRVDVKYVMTREQSEAALRACVGRYRVMEVGGSRISAYETVYYDTPEMSFYHEHHAGRLTRRKVRVRRYCHTGEAYLEVKHRQNRGLTVKTRVPLEADGPGDLGVLLADPMFGGCGPLPTGRLRPSLAVRYRRVTLVDTATAERVTLDFGLSFDHAGRRLGLDGIVVAEVKQRRRGPSFFRTLMRGLRIRPGSLSKYCIGAVGLHSGVRKNRFKARYRRILELLTHETATHTQ